jgi:hypothetical protein
MTKPTHLHKSITHKNNHLKNKIELKLKLNLQTIINLLKTTKRAIKLKSHQSFNKINLSKILIQKPITLILKSITMISLLK